MKILFAHNRYLLPGGEDQSVEAERAMLSAAGHEVDLWLVSNETVSKKGAIATGLGAIHSGDAVRELRRRLAARTYDVLHVHNQFPLLSPSIHRVAAACGVATIQHLRNYRMMCVNSGFFRDGKVCRDCATSFAPWRGVLRACYRDSVSASVAPAAMVAVHRATGTFSRSIDGYVAISGHVRNEHLAAGFPAERIDVRYNTANIEDPAQQLPPGALPEARIVVPGRLMREKGVDIAIAAWRARPRQAVLHIAGSGPEDARLRGLAAGDATIRFEGQMDRQALTALMARSRAVVNCALWAEPFGRTPMEAFAVGTPAIVSNIGGLTEIVDHDRNGLIVAPGDVAGFDSAFCAMLGGDERHLRMREAAALTFKTRFAPSAILPQTEAIYYRAIERRRALMAIDQG